MALRFDGNMRGERFVGNTLTLEVHDLLNEKTLCQIDEILKAGNDEPILTLFEAKLKGYDHCPYCIIDEDFRKN